jgi:membrane-associated phospholipid phosphatase
MGMAGLQGVKIHRGRARRWLVGLVVTGATLVSWSETRAEAQELRTSAPVDSVVTLVGAGAWIVSDGLKEQLVAPHCRWCDRDETNRDTLNPLDRSVRHLRWKNAELAARLSNLSAFVGMPVLAAGTLSLSAAHDGRSHEIGADLVVVAESGVLAADLNQLVKYLVVRERPYAHAFALIDPTVPRASAEDDLSFYSGHTSESVSLAVAAGTVASIRQYRLAPLVWATSLPLALVTGYLRIGADRHYFTDVLTGAVVGAAIGFLVPYVFHRGDETTGVPAATGSTGSNGQGGVLGFSGVW